MQVERALSVRLFYSLKLSQRFHPNSSYPTYFRIDSRYPVGEHTIHLYGALRSTCYGAH